MQIIISICIVTFSFGSLHAEWIENGISICTSSGYQLEPVIAADGSGGAIIAWPDGRDVLNGYDIFAQKVDAEGVVQWTANGVPVCTHADEQRYLAIVCDGADGAFIAWMDRRAAPNWMAYVQRIDADGNPLWIVDGIPACTDTFSQNNPYIMTDNEDGAIVVWEDYRNGQRDIYAQRLNSDGIRMWDPEGIAICTAAGEQYLSKSISIGNGGMIISWTDRRSSPLRIYAQRIDWTGSAQWTTDGIPISMQKSRGDQIIADGNGGAFIPYMMRNDDDIFNVHDDIYIQRIDSEGNVLWGNDGVAACTSPRDQVLPMVAPDGEGGAFTTWEDFRDDREDIYAQRVDSAGVIQWQEDGALVCGTDSRQWRPGILSDGYGGAYIVWGDMEIGGDFDLYIQKMSSDGSRYGPDGGIPVCTEVGDQWYEWHPDICSDGAFGVIITWKDGRVAEDDIYAQRIDYADIVNVKGDDALPDIIFRQNYPNPFNPTTILHFLLPNSGMVRIDVYNIAGRMVSTLADGFMQAGKHEVVWDGRNHAGRQVSSGIYFAHLISGEIKATQKLVLLK